MFDPDPPYLRWCTIKNGTMAESVDAFDSKCMDHILLHAGDLVEGVGYMLYHGGVLLQDTVTPVNEATIRAISQSVSFLPEHNEMTLKLVQRIAAEFPGVPHLLFCDTAFFAGLPLEASTYAVPYELREEGIKRFGGYGMFHEHAWQQSQILLKPLPSKVISIILGNHTNVAAIDEGKAVESSIGFTPVEGTISVSSCGDIDPTIVFQLLASGMSLPEINRSLTLESGFSGILDRRCTFHDIMQGSAEPGMQFVREKLVYDLLRYIGAFTAILGGVDAFVFQVDDIEESQWFVGRVCDSLKFLGLRRVKDLRRQKEHTMVSDVGSKIAAVSITTNKWQIMRQYIEQYMHKEQ